MKSEPEVNYLYSFLVAGMSIGKFQISEGHTDEVNDFMTNYEQ
ncbi:hypothetical protein [Anaerosporobacter sp.]|nr:hypothetical protein [Anaerosporobacter sp.]